MKKTIIALMGLFTLMACSDDVYEEIDKQNKDLENDNSFEMQTNSFDDSNPGWIDLTGGGSFINIGNGYQSPWDVWFRNAPFTPNYQFSNQGGPGHSSPLTIHITPWAGLAYYDGINDGMYNDDFLLANSPSGLVADFTLGGYPNLYVGNNEVGNLIEGEMITLDGTSLAESEIGIASDPANMSGPGPQHLLSAVGNLNPAAYQGKPGSFNFPSLNPAETLLMEQYGKIFIFEVTVRRGPTGPIIGNYFVQVENETLDGPSGPTNNNWKSTGISVSVPGLAGTRDVYYYHNQTPGVSNETIWNFAYPIMSTTNNPDFFCNSREVVIKDAHPSSRPITTYTRPWEVRVVMAIGSNLWRTSGPYLVVRPT